MKAMILAAGLGTRLKPITNRKPKALVEVGGVPLLEIMIKKLVGFGFTDIIINVHHFADQVIDFLKGRNNFNINIAVSDEREELLNTGGGVKKASWFFNDDKDFLLINVDIITDIDLVKLYESHCRERSLVTLAVRDRATQRYFLFDNESRLCGWENKKTGERRVMRDEKNLIPLAFSGIHVINPYLFELIKHEGSFSLVDLYLDLAAGHKIMGYKHDDDNWVDVGKIKDLEWLSNNN